MTVPHSGHSPPAAVVAAEVVVTEVVGWPLPIAVVVVVVVTVVVEVAVVVVSGVVGPSLTMTEVVVTGVVAEAVVGGVLEASLHVGTSQYSQRFPGSVV